MSVVRVFDSPWDYQKNIVDLAPTRPYVMGIETQGVTQWHSPEQSST